MNPVQDAANVVNVSSITEARIRYQVVSLQKRAKGHMTDLSSFLRKTENSAKRQP